MVSPVVVPPLDTNLGGLRRSTTDLAASTSKTTSDWGSGAGKDTALLRRAVTANVVRSSTIPGRKKLPWLEDSQTKTDSKQDGQQETCLQNSSAPTPENPRPAKNTSAFGNAAAASTQASSSSKPVPSRDARESQQLTTSLQYARMNNHASSSHRPVYASSEYSAQTSSAEEPMPTSLPRKDPASYEKLVMTPQVSHTETLRLHQQDPERAKDNARRFSQVSTSVKAGDHRHYGTRKPKPKSSLHRKYAESSSHTEQRQRCKSCDESLNLRKTNEQPVPSSQHRRSSHNLGRPRCKSDADTRRRPSSLNPAVTGLENLIEEALSVARDAARAGRAEDVAAMLNGATLALREAGSVQSGMHQPLRLSPRASLNSSKFGKGDVSSNGSSVSRARVSSETLPTIITQNGRSSKKRLRREVKHAHASEDESMSRTSPRLYTAASADSSIVRDFAFSNGRVRRRHSDSAADGMIMYGSAASFYGDQGQSVAVQPGVRKSIAGDDKLVVPPAPAHIRNARRSLGKHDRVFRAHHKERDEQDRGLPGAEYTDPLQQEIPTSRHTDSRNRESPGQLAPNQNPFTDNAAVRGVEREQEADDDDSLSSSEIKKPQPSEYGCRVSRLCSKKPC